ARPSKWATKGKAMPHQRGPQPGDLRNGAQQLPLGVAPWTSYFVDRIRFLVLPQNLCDLRRHVVHVDRLEPRLAVAEYRIGWHGPQQPENCRKKCIVRRKHYCRADNDCAGKCGLYGRFTLAAAANIG